MKAYEYYSLEALNTALAEFEKNSVKIISVTPFNTSDFIVVYSVIVDDLPKNYRVEKVKDARVDVPNSCASYQFYNNQNAE